MLMKVYVKETFSLRAEAGEVTLHPSSGTAHVCTSPLGCVYLLLSCVGDE
jgi:hypothetical protein